MADTDSLAAAAAELILDEEHNAPKELQPADTELHEATECGANNEGATIITGPALPNPSSVWRKWILIHQILDC